MDHLAPELRKQLEKAVVEARTLAERGARSALEALAVGQHESHGSMSDEEKLLRRRLRAHGKQFGDRRDERGRQAIERLVREVAYEHWHRMLFARFLAENGLLIEPSNQVPVSLEDVDALARERGLEPWAMAALFAQRMLPMIFRTDDPVLQVALPPEVLQPLQQSVKGLDPLVFAADDALGWTYQFWQKAEKDAVNARVKSGAKIDGETLPAVTQLFTEPYMVQFLLQNTLGAWYAGKVLAQNPELAARANGEAELRAALALPGCAFEYLRFVRENDGAPWRPAAGTFAGWPRTAKELRVLDPCCGSGHFLVAAWELLAALRQHEEGLAAAEAGEAVLRDNLFGLELDARCVQIAAFALAMAAWKRAGVVSTLPPLQVACCGVGPSGTATEWTAFADRVQLDGDRRNALRRGMAKLHALFTQAPDLGSLIDVRQVREEGFAAPVEKLLPLLEQALRAEGPGGDDEQHERVVAAQGMATAAAILGQTFTLVATNVPYRKGGDLGPDLNLFIKQHHANAKANLATVFVQRALDWLGGAGTLAVVTPQEWLSLTSSRKLRETLLKERTWNCVARLGPRAFETIGGHVVSVVLLAVSASKAAEDHVLAGLDVSAARLPAQKDTLLRGEVMEPPGSEEARGRGAADETQLYLEGEGEDEGVGESIGPADGTLLMLSQVEQLKNPDARIILSPGDSAPLLNRLATALQGTTTGDNAQFLREMWEVPESGTIWSWFQGTVKEPGCFGGCSRRIRWEGGGGQLARLKSARVQGLSARGKPGVSIGQMASLPTCLYAGEMFSMNAAAIVPSDPSHLPAIWSFCSSAELTTAIRSIDQNLKVTNATLGKVPFDLARWQGVAIGQYPLGLPEPQTNDPTQWLFHGHPAGMLAAGPASASPFAIEDHVGRTRHRSLLCRLPNAADVLQVATARLVGYRWPAERDPDMRLDVAQREWAARTEALLPFADQDGIVCLNPILGEASAADRVRAMLRAAFGPHWRPDTEPKLLAAAVGSSAASLEDWLRDEFFAAHCKLFHDRPFVWHVWDGKKDGFHALVNYHKLAGHSGEGRRTLELLAFTYLKDWIDLQQDNRRVNEPGADALLAAALSLQDELKKILVGEPRHDLFVRWKPLHQQPIGWEPDINDGVRVNIRPFVRAESVKYEGAGVLRTKVDVDWDRDDGREPEALRPRAQFPWFWSRNPALLAHQRDYQAPATAAFDCVRHNDLHYTRAAKEQARREHAQQQGSGSTRNHA